MKILYIRNSIIGIAFIWILSSAIMNVNGPGGGYSNASGESNCTSCHGGSIITSSNSNLSNIRLNGNFTGGGYIPDSSYTIEITFKQTGKSKFGFQVTSLDANNDPCGTVTNTNTRSSRVTASISGKTREYIQHTALGTSAVGTDSTRWTFTWKAPASNVGKINFHLVLMAANGNSTNDAGDIVYGKTFQISPSALLPVATAFSNDSNTCTGYNVQLSGSGSNTPLAYSWKMPGGSPAVSTLQNPVLSYAAPGLKQVILSVRNSKGWSLPDTFAIQVNNSPSAIITTGSAASICQGDSLLLSANTGTGLTYLWLHNNKTTRTVWVRDSAQYRVRVSGSNACVRTSNPFRLNWYAQPGIQISKTHAGDSFCGFYSDTITASATHADSIHWYLNGVLSRRTKTMSTVFSGTQPVQITARAKSVNACFSPMSNVLKMVAVSPLYPQNLSIVKTTSTIRLQWKKPAGVSTMLYSLDQSVFQNTDTDSGLTLSGLQPNTLYSIRLRSMQSSPCLLTDTLIQVRTNVCSNLQYLIDINNRVCRGTAITATVQMMQSSGFSISFGRGAFGSATQYTFTPLVSDTLEISIYDSLNPTCPPLIEKLFYRVDTLFDTDTAFSPRRVNSCSDTFRLSLRSGYQRYQFYQNGVLQYDGSDSVYVFRSLGSSDTLQAQAAVNSCTKTWGAVYFSRSEQANAGFSYSRNWKIYTLKADDTLQTGYLWKAGAVVLGNTAVLQSDLSVFGDSVLALSLETENSQGCRALTVQNLILPDFSSLNLLTRSPFRVYPNPAGDEVYVESGGRSVVIQVQDGLGREVFSGPANGDRLEIASSEWVPGVYRILIRDEQGRTYLHKVVKL